MIRMGLILAVTAICNPAFADGIRYQHDNHGNTTTYQDIGSNTYYHNNHGDSGTIQHIGNTDYGHDSGGNSWTTTRMPSYDAPGVQMPSYRNDD